jgi:hypothetical protein
MSNTLTSDSPATLTTAAPVAISVDGLGVFVSNLIAEREVWQKNAYASSNTQLYTLLGKCLDLYNTVKASSTLPRGLNEILRSLKVTFNEGTSLELRIVRLVFATPGSEKCVSTRVNAYARVIKVAAVHKQTAATLPQFIADNHGVEEIRRNGINGNVQKPSEVNKSYRDRAENSLIAPNIPTIFANFELPEVMMPMDGKRFSLALVRKNPDDTGSIVFATSNVTAVNAVLAIAGKDITDKRAKEIAEQLDKEAAAQRDENLAEFLTAANGSQLAA